MLIASFIVLSYIIVGACSFWLGHLWSRRHRAPWLVRPHTRHTLPRVPDPDPDSPMVVDGRFERGRTGRSNSTME